MLENRRGQTGNEGNNQANTLLLNPRGATQSLNFQRGGKWLKNVRKGGGGGEEEERGGEKKEKEKKEIAILNYISKMLFSLV